MAVDKKILGHLVPYNVRPADIEVVRYLKKEGSSQFVDILEGTRYEEAHVRNVLSDLQSFNIVQKDYDGRQVYYRICDWNTYKYGTWDKLRKRAKRNIFDE